MCLGDYTVLPGVPLSHAVMGTQTKEILGLDKLARSHDTWIGLDLQMVSLGYRNYCLLPAAPSVIGCTDSAHTDV